MDRNRDSRRASIVGSNGFSRRRHRTNSTRDSPGEDGGLELQESARLRERVKKDRGRDRERERERERERDLKERSSRSKRRRPERLASNRDDTGGDETSYESLDDDYEENVSSGAGGVRMLSPTVGSFALPHHHGHAGNPHHHGHNSSFSQQPQHNINSTGNTVSNSGCHLQHRKTFPPIPSSSSKIQRAPRFGKSTDEIINVSVPRKARSASTKRSHEWISSSSNNNNSGGISGGVDQNPAPPSRSGARLTHVSASAAPPTAAPLSQSSNASIRKKLKHSSDNTGGPKLKPTKVPASSSKPISLNPEELELEIAEVLYGLMTQSQGPSSSKKEESREVNRSSVDAKSRNSSPIPSSTPDNTNLPNGSDSAPLPAVAPKKKRPRQVPESSNAGARIIPETVHTPKNETLSPNVEKVSGSADDAAASEEIGGVPVISQGQAAEPPVPKAQVSMKPDLGPIPAAEEFRKSCDLVGKADVISSQEQESPAVRAQDPSCRDSPPVATASSAADTTIHANLSVSDFGNQKEEKFEVDLTDMKPVAISKNIENEKGESGSGIDRSSNVATEVKKSEESESNEAVENSDQTNSQIDTQKPGHSTCSMPLPMPMVSWSGGLPPMGYMTPWQGVVSMDGNSVSPSHIQPFFSQLRPKRCATHCHIARNIHCLQQFMKMNPFWPAPAGPPASLFGSKPCNLNVGLPAESSISARYVASSQEKVPPGLTGAPNDASLPPAVAPTNLLGPAFLFPAATATAGKYPSAASAASAAYTTAPTTATSFSYPNMSQNETTQYLAILQNGAYPYPIPTVGAPPIPLINGPFFSSQIIHHHQQQQVAQPHSNAPAPNNSSSSPGKHLQPRPPQNSFSTQKSHPSHSTQYSNRGGEDGPPAIENRGSRASVNIYGQNFALPNHPAASNNHSEKNSHQGLPHHTFAMSFGPINGTPSGPGIDRASMAQNQAMNGPNAHGPAQLHQQQQQQQMGATKTDNRAKVPLTNGIIYSEHLTSSAMAAPKFQNTISPFPQNLIQSNGPSSSPSQSTHWQNSARTPGPQAQGPSSVSLHKNIGQQIALVQPPMGTQISFWNNQKPSVSSQVGSSATSSISKGATNKTGHGSPFLTQQPKNTLPMPTQKVPSILGNPHAAKNQAQPQPKPKIMQPTQLFFSGSYAQSRPHHSNDPATAIAAATSNAKAGGLQSQGMIHGPMFGAQSSGGILLPAGLSYVQPAEQKPSAGNDNLHPWQPEKK